MGQRVFNMDALTILKDAGLVASSAAAQVASANRILDVGPARFDGTVVLNVTAIEIADNNELYTVVVQGSSSATFASDIQNLAQMSFGATEVRPGGAIDSVAGVYELPVTNEQNDISYRYIRLFTVCAGTIATGINYSAYLSTKPGG